ncbi:MAG: TonB-dependent receptor plug domain-containing protein [Bacteroidales bacterium]|nr:TonB-dependent receptor plug domain-containing protein [Bacteroidales bacterium]MDD3665283.1 TonB-dependent receptor plug domain-containing protein [Bacteroidales bacterium]
MSSCVKKFSVVLATLLLSGYWLHGQQPDSVIALREVAIVATPVRQVSTSTFNENIAPQIISRFQTQPLSNLLSRNSSIQINQYGPGGLSTVSLRGSGSSQTAILWNGFNLQSPMNGGMSLSQIPLHFVDAIQVNHGGQSAQKGSSAIGGVIQINNNAEPTPGTTVSLTQSMGSFGHLFSGIKLNYAVGAVAFSTRIFRQSATNDFPFINTARFGRPEMKQTNAGMLQYGMLQTAFWQIKPGQQLTARIWLQRYDKNIPPLMTNLDSRQNQIDNDYRFMAEWKGSKNNLQWNLRSGYLYNKQLYSDKATATFADNRASSWQTNFEGMMRLSARHTLVLQAGNSLETGQSDNYTALRKRNIAWLMAGYKLSLSNNRFVMTANLREELTDLNATTPTFALGTDLALSKHLNIHSNIARSFRMPTLNDLYWNVWGNPNLRPEEGYTADLGLNFACGNKQWKTTGNATAYSNWINHWIIWMPKGSIWTPENLKKVWSRGIETQGTLSYTGSQMGTSLQVKYQYTRVSQTDNNPGVETRQLIYQPYHKGVATLELSYHQSELSITQSFTGRRYTNETNTSWLDRFSITDLTISTRFLKDKWDATLQFKLNNLADVTYQTIAWYAMPGRNFEIAINLSIHHKPLLTKKQ